MYLHALVAYRRARYGIRPELAAADPAGHRAGRGVARLGVVAWSRTGSRLGRGWAGRHRPRGCGARPAAPLAGRRAGRGDGRGDRGAAVPGERRRPRPRQHRRGDRAVLRDGAPLAAPEPRRHAARGDQRHGPFPRPQRVCSGPARRGDGELRHPRAGAGARPVPVPVAGGAAGSRRPAGARRSRQPLGCHGRAAAAGPRAARRRRPPLDLDRGDRGGGGAAARTTGAAHPGADLHGEHRPGNPRGPTPAGRCHGRRHRPGAAPAGPGCRAGRRVCPARPAGDCASRRRCRARAARRGRGGVRHRAPGAAVTVRLAGRPETLELTIDDEGVACAGSDEPLGSGRGLTGMRERAEALGGSVAAGPRQAGGWTVAATLPVAATPPVAATLPVGTPPVLDQVAEPDPSSSPGWWRRLRHEQVIDAAIALAAVSLPLAIAISVIDEDPSGVAVVGATPLALMTLLLVAHGLPLLWRRQAPWRVLAAVALANCLWPVAVALKLLSPTSTFIAPGAFAACAAVYSVALWGRPDWATWISIPVAVLAITTSTATGLVLDPTLADQPPTTETVLFVGVGMAICAGPEILAVWGAGMAVRLRRGHTIQREHGALAVAATRAAYAARIERSRIAAGLRDSVLDLASSLTTTADAGRQALADGSTAAARERLTEASTQARAALAAMRELLEMLHSNHLPADRSPQPTAASIEQLCQHQRSIGRPVILHTSGAPLGLPAEVGVSAYRIVAAALGAGDRGPAKVTLIYCRDDLRISVSGVPAATVGPIAAGLRERVAAFGGRIALSRNNGTVDVVLPARVEEVTPSPSA